MYMLGQALKNFTLLVLPTALLVTQMSNNDERWRIHESYQGFVQILSKVFLGNVENNRDQLVLIKQK